MPAGLSLCSSFDRKHCAPTVTVPFKAMDRRGCGVFTDALAQHRAGNCVPWPRKPIPRLVHIPVFLGGGSI